MEEVFQNKLSQSLQALNKYELNQFKKYILSPFFNENEKLCQLFEFFLPYAKNRQAINKSKEFIWNKIFAGQKYNDTKFRRINSDLLKLFEGFLSYKVYTENPVIPQLSLLQGICDKGLESLQNSNLKKAKNLQDSPQLRNGEYFYHEYKLQTIISDLNALQFNRSEQINIDKIVDNLDYFYLSQKLKYYCELVNSKKVFQIAYEPIFIQEIIQHLEKVSYDEIPAIAIYYRILKMLIYENQETEYGELCQLLDEHSNKFPLNESRMMYGFAQNYCIKKINTGQQEYLNEIFKLYKTVLDKKVILNNEILSPWDYKNIITVGLRIKEFDWIEKFIEDYSNNLPLEYKKNAYTFNLAKLNFSKGNYEQVIELLIEVEYQDIFYLLDSKSMLLKTYYEIGEEEALYGLIESFKILLSRKKVVSNQYRKNYNNLLKHVKKLIAVKNGHHKKLILLKKELAEDSNVADLSWLKEKILELE